MSHGGKIVGEERFRRFNLREIAELMPDIIARHPGLNEVLAYIAGADSDQIAAMMFEIKERIDDLVKTEFAHKINGNVSAEAEE